MASLKATNLSCIKCVCADAPHFVPSEFRCGCHGKKCSGYPVKLSPALVFHLELLRAHFGKPVVITSGMRCKSYNNSLKGSVKNSAHVKGKAADIYIKGVDPADIVKYWKGLNIGYSYCGTANMGNAAHVQIGW